MTCKIKKKLLLYFLSVYIFFLFLMDYSILYQLALLITFIFTLIFYKGKIILKSDYLLFFGLFIGYFMLHTLGGLSVNSTLSVEYLKTLVINYCSAIIIIRILNTKEKIEFIMKVCIISTFITCLYVIFKDFSNLFSGSLGGGVLKPFGLGGAYSHNDVSWICGLSICFLIYFCKSSNDFKFKKLFIVFFLVFIVLTGARKSIIFAIFGLIMYPYIFLKQKSNSKNLLRIISAVLLCIIAYLAIMNVNFLYNIIGYRFEGFLGGLNDGEFEESSAKSRSIMIETAINLIKKKPILGYGLNTFRTFPGSFGTWSHVNYLEIIVSGGILPLIIYYSYHVKSVIKLFKLKNDKMGALFLTILVFLFIHDALSISYISRHVVLILSMIQAYLLIYNKPNSEENS